MRSVLRTLPESDGEFSVSPVSSGDHFLFNVFEESKSSLGGSKHGSEPLDSIYFNGFG